MGVANFLAPEMIANGILQDSLEQQWKLCGWLVAIILCQFNHGFLHDIQRRLFVAYGVGRMLEGAALDAGEKIGKLD